MKNAKLIIGLFTILLTACNNNQESDLTRLTTDNQTNIDTIVGKKIIAIDALDSSRVRRETEYFVIAGNDTSDNNSTFIEYKNGEVYVRLNMRDTTASTSYRQQMEEFKAILNSAANDFNFDSLSSFSFGGRLISTGDLVINVTREHIQKFGDKTNYDDYKTFEKFLKTSKLGNDIDGVFKPYSIFIDNIDIEKLTLVNSGGSLFKTRKIETDSTSIPDKVFDCSMWIRLKKK